MSIVRPRRSVLYMPGANARAQEKAKSLTADALILDLEDAVAPDAKAEARKTVCENVKAGGYGGRELIIRINGLDTPWGCDDLAAACDAGPDAILVPKVERADQVKAIEGLMGTAPAHTAIWVMIETPLGVLHAEQIAFASQRLACFVMGTSDLVKEVQGQHTPMRLPMLTSLSLAILAGRAAGLTVLDGVFLGINDENGIQAACQQGFELGFDGKTLIHPSQLAAANAVFGPKPEDVDYSKQVIEAFAEAEAEGKGVAVVDGKLVENLHVEIAQRTVALAEAIAALEAENAA